MEYYAAKLLFQCIFGILIVFIYFCRAHIKIINIDKLDSEYPSRVREIKRHNNKCNLGIGFFILLSIALVFAPL